MIEISRDIERYKETAALGLTAGQLAFSAASVAVGGGIVMLLYPLVGLTFSVYVAVPAVVPVALGGFYSYNGMNFYEFMRRKMRMMFLNRPLVYVSTEGEEMIRAVRLEEEAEKKRAEKIKRRSRNKKREELKA